MVEVYTEPLARRHYAGLFSVATIFRIVILLAAIGASLVIAYASGGFWVKVKPTLDQATVHYTQDALLVFTGATSEHQMVWSTSPAMQQVFADYLVPASVQYAEEDINFDGKPDIIMFSASVQSNVPIHGVQALLQFHYSFKSNVKLDMYSFAYFSANSVAPGGVLSVDGELLLSQRTPITDRKYNDIYNTKMLTSDTPTTQQAVQPATELQFSQILRSYNSNNYTTYYGNTYPVWKSGSGNTFEIVMTIRIPANQVVWYRPQVIEMLKFGWIQFLVTWVVLWWFYRWFEAFVFKYRMLATRVVSDVQRPSTKF
ncbi:hypothetical protein FOA52_012445 [Chlamydomonas sp. UWO 241]|nr:hypothetical protein FOA52_012445 [Chlamydomonas sp. UWO 241]